MLVVVTVIAELVTVVVQEIAANTAAVEGIAELIALQLYLVVVSDF